MAPNEKRVKSKDRSVLGEIGHSAAASEPVKITPAAIPSLFALLRSGDPRERRAGVKGSAELGADGQVAVGTLIDLQLLDDDPEVRWLAEEARARIREALRRKDS
jgi:hypothetical protein